MCSLVQIAFLIAEDDDGNLTDRSVELKSGIIAHGDIFTSTRTVSHSDWDWYLVTF